ncbi:hypothetical protein D5R40_31980 [Okeania hirsuta]|uniref:Uncharacterized protein n=1 Tax=Okeania hirsuta TaxID=1458930 RepID=A0A3N6NT30_9CYAN|nr:hypothetical protein D5R40_31980 [Okeania hirsuta]
MPNPTSIHYGRYGKTIHTPDSTRAEAFKHYIDKGYFGPKPDSAVILTDLLYEFCRNTDNKIGMVDALSLVGYLYFRIGKYPEALDSYKKGLRLSEEVKFKKRNC